MEYINQRENEREHRLKVFEIKVFEIEEPIWKAEDHPELKDGAAEWVRKIRAECEDRFQKMQRHRDRD